MESHQLTQVSKKLRYGQLAPLDLATTIHQIILYFRCKCNTKQK